MRELRFTGLKRTAPIVAGEDESLALAVVRAAADFQPEGTFIEVDDPDFDTFVAEQIAKALVRESIPRGELPQLEADIARGDPNAGEKKGKSTRALAQLASYAQNEWDGKFIRCPVEGRLSSLFLALSRLHRNNKGLWEDVFKQIYVA